MKCPICQTDNEQNMSICSICGFEQPQREFINQDEYELWLKEVVQPYRDNYKANKKYPKLSSESAQQFEETLQLLAKTLSPREVQIIRMLLGLDGEPMSRLEISKVYNVCVNRIYQIEAKLLRKLRHYKWVDNNQHAEMRKE